MSRYEILRYPNAQALARDAAARFIGACAVATPARPLFVALSGGRIAVRFFDDVVAEWSLRQRGWENVEFFFADERWVPLDHPESNYRLAHEHLFQPLHVPPERVHPLYSAAGHEASASEAGNTLRRLLPPDPNGSQALDLVILGMGEDGHVASIFPGASQEVLASKAVYIPVVGPKPPPLRITLTCHALASAREVWVLISGSGKEGALRDALGREGLTPLARVLESRNHTRLLTDIGSDAFT